jgi:GT2 family glycosyltransferase
MSLIGIAIATHNSGEVIGSCLSAFRELECVVVVFDDGSTDDTVSIARSVRPDVVVLHGTGDQWWAGGTHQALEACFQRGCEFAILLNPDVEISAESLQVLARFASAQANVWAGALVVDRDAPHLIAWAGSRFSQVLPLIHSSRYIAKRGEPVATVGAVPYPTDELHGRGVIVSRATYQALGGLDWRTFPHYGADIDLSFRARRAGISLYVVPAAKAYLATERSGMHFTNRSLTGRLHGIFQYLTKTKNGDAIRVWWRLFNRHIPKTALLPSFSFVLLLNVFRRLERR